MRSAKSGVERIVRIASGLGQENQTGSLPVGKFADMLMLSDDPLAVENRPRNLKDIRVLGTVRHGRHFPNPTGHLPPRGPG